MQVCLFLHSEGWAKMIVVIASMLQTLNIEHNLFWTQNIPLMTDWHFLPHASVLKHVPVRLAYARVWSLTPFLSYHFMSRWLLCSPTTIPPPLWSPFTAACWQRWCPYPSKCHLPERWDSKYTTMNDCHVFKPSRLIFDTITSYSACPQSFFPAWTHTVKCQPDSQYSAKY